MTKNQSFDQTIKTCVLAKTLYFSFKWGPLSCEAFMNRDQMEQSEYLTKNFHKAKENAAEVP